MPYATHILFTFLTQQVMLFAFYFFLRKKELRLAQQVRFSLLKLRWMVCHFGIEI